MKIAVTGATGGIGRKIVSMALERGHTLVGIDRVTHPDIVESDRLRFVQADVSDYDTLVEAFAGCDGVIHMAAIPSPGRHPDHVVHNNNVVGSYNALRAAAEHGIKRVCQASSVNAIGHSYSRAPRYDWFPLDETHPNYSEDPYSLSKWICELQADSFARRYEDMVIASMRFHLVVDERSIAVDIFTNLLEVDKHLWAYTRRDAAADACLKSLEAPFKGHEVFYIVAPDTVSDVPSLDLAAQHFPTIPVTDSFGAHMSFFNSHKAERLLGWKHGNVPENRLKA